MGTSVVIALQSEAAATGPARWPLGQLKGLGTTGPSLGEEELGLEGDNAGLPRHQAEDPQVKSWHPICLCSLVLLKTLSMKCIFGGS